MDEFAKSVVETMESLAEIVDDFFLEVTEIVEELADEWHNTIGVELEKCWQELVEPIVELYDFDSEEQISETEHIFTEPITPSLKLHPACIGCRHYHGQSYGGNLLVCAMHPYGWDHQNCPDWESS